MKKTLMLGKIEGRREKWVTEDEMVGWLTNSMDMSLSKLWEIMKDRSLACYSPWGCIQSDMTD